jgi:hypothetical protein
LSGVWLANALVERTRESLAGIVIVLLGIPFYLYWKARKAEPAPAATPSDDSLERNRAHR